MTIPVIDRAPDDDEPADLRVPVASPLPGTAPVAERCPSCAAPLGARFCGRCGERRAADRQYSLRHFLGEFAASMTNADVSVWRTLAALLRRPGELTAAYMRGERVRYMKPVQLFVLVSIAYFVITGLTGTRAYDTPLRQHMRDPRLGLTAQRMVVERLAERRIHYDAFATSFDKTATTQAKSLVIVMVPVFALAVALVEVRRRRFALQHLVFALHAYTFLLLLNVLVDLVLLSGIKLVAQASGGDINWRAIDQLVGLSIAVPLFVYLWLALRRAYGDRRLVAAVKAGALVAAVVAILIAYRYLLYFTTYWAT